MEIIKRALSLYVLVLSVCASASVFNLQQVDSEFIQNNDNMHDNCVCLPKNQPQTYVRQILDPRQNGLERLVVFLYFNPTTGSVNVFTPNKKVQRMIPDVPYESSEDTLNVVPELVGDFFKLNPNRIRLEVSNHLSYFQDFIVNSDINVGPVDDIYNQDMYSMTEILNPGFNMVRPSSDESQLVDTPVDYLDFQSYLYPASSSVVHPGMQYYENRETIVKPRFQTHAYPEVVRSELDIVGELNTLPYFRQPKVVHKTIDKIEYKGRPDVISSVLKVNPDVFTADMYNYEVENNDHRSIRFKNIFRDYVTNVDQGIGPVMGDKKYLTFNRWFLEQLTKFIKLHSSLDVKAFDVIAVKRQVEKTLQDNNMVLSEEGILRDSKGNILDLSHLELRPVFMGEPVGYSSLWGSLNRKLKLHKKVPYLEGLMVSIDYPPKVLGVIPLGQAVMSRGSLNEPAALGSSANMISSNVVTVSSEIDGLSEFVTHPRVTHQYLPSKLSRDVSSRLEESELIFEPEITDVVHEIGVSSNLGLRSAADETHMPKFLNKLFEMMSFPNRRKGKKSDPSDVSGEKSDMKHDGEVVKPGFRIIGGSAATGSGTPLSNRGRSGSE